MGARIVWVLNLDADIELGTPGRYSPRARTIEAMRPHVLTLASALLRPGEALLELSTPESVGGDAIGRAFCPTEHAVASMLACGASPERHPSMSVLRLVNSRAFSQSLGACLEGSGFFTTTSSAKDVLGEAPPIGDGWRVKCAHGMAGRNQRVIRQGRLAPLDDAFVTRGIAQGGVQIEPNVVIEQELARHGFLRPDGSFDAGALVYQRCDARGAWLSSERAPSGCDRDVETALGDEVHRVASALRSAEYFGPFGVDGFLYAGRGGRRLLQPRSEINARYSMGFTVGFGPPPPPLR
jgi:hypothetical protein